LTPLPGARLPPHWQLGSLKEVGPEKLSLTGAIMMPEQIPNESARAYAAFKKYVELGDKRSIRKLCQKHGRDRATCEKWSKKYRWRKRLRELELKDCERAVAADEKAKLDVATERERLALRHTEQKLKASERLFEAAGGKTVSLSSACASAIQIVCP
jgi:hypothetical protein